MHAHGLERASPGEVLRTLPAASRLALGLWAATLLVLVVHFAAFLNAALAAVSFPFGLDYGEGIVWQQAALIPSARMYGDIDRYPFLVFHYPPVYHLAVRAVAALGANPLLAGRSLSLCASLATGGLIAALVSRAAREHAGHVAARIGGAVAGLSFFCWWPVVIWSPLMRVDMLAVALSVLGVWCALRSLSRPWLLHAAAVAFVLAVFTKQTCVAAPLASMAVMLAIDARRTLKACCVGLLLGGAALAILTWATHGGFLRHVLLYNLNRYSPLAAGRAVMAQAPHVVFFDVALLGLALGWRRVVMAQARAGLGMRESLRRSEASRSLAVITLYCVFTTGMLATIGKSGSSVNYFIEWMAVLSILIGLAVAPAVATAASPARGLAGWIGPLWSVIVPAALLVQVARLPASPGYDLSDQSRAELAGLVARIRDASRPVLSDDMVLLMKAGQQVPWEPAIFAELASTGRWDERRITDLIAARRFAFVVTSGRRGTPMYDSRYTAAVDRAIETAYPRIEQRAGLTVHLPPA